MGEDEKGFTIKDRRTFSEDQAEPEEETAEGTQDKEEGEDASSRPGGESAEEDDTQLPEVNFATFIFSLSSSALLHFGEIPDPATGTTKKSLPLAKQSIDILSMLEEKTRGNLTEDEEQLIKNILYDLRMRYVKETQ